MLELEEYKIPRALMSRIIEVVGDACFWYEDGESFNNDDVISVHERLMAEIKRQEEYERRND